MRCTFQYECIVTPFPAFWQICFEKEARYGRTRNAVERMLAALDAPAYDLGVLSERGMLPGLANRPRRLFSPGIPLLKAHNARGRAHLHPASRRAPLHRPRRPDSRNPLQRLAADGYEPCAVVETSRGNFQAWLKHDRTCTRRRSPRSLRRPSPGGTERTRAPRTGGALAVCPDSPTASRSTAARTDSYPYVLLRVRSGVEFRHGGLFAPGNDEALPASGAGAGSPRRPTSAEACTCIRPGRLIRASPLSGSATRPSSTTAPPPPTSPSASPPFSLRMPDDAIAATLDSQLSLPRSQPLPARCLHSPHDGEGEIMGASGKRHVCSGTRPDASARKFDVAGLRTQPFIPSRVPLQF